MKIFKSIKLIRGNELIVFNNLKEIEFNWADLLNGSSIERPDPRFL